MGAILDVITSLMIGIIMSHLFTNLSLSIYISIIFIFQYYFSYLNGSAKITNFEYLFVVFFPSFSTPSLLSSLYRVDIHFIGDSISPIFIISASFVKCMVSLSIYTLIVWKKIYRKRFEELVRQKGDRQKESIITDTQKH